MKAILGSLLCYVLMASQCFALKGGPPFFNGHKAITGNYAGILFPTSVCPTPTKSPPAPNALAIFTVTIPQTGLASGSFLAFVSGRTFLGSIQGIGDPNKRSLTAVVQGIPIVTSGDTTETTMNVHADGTLTAKVKKPSNAFVISSTRLSGIALIKVTIGGDSESTTCFVVDGFLQST